MHKQRLTHFMNTQKWNYFFEAYIINKMTETVISGREIFHLPPMFCHNNLAKKHFNENTQTEVSTFFINEKVVTYWIKKPQAHTFKFIHFYILRQWRHLWVKKKVVRTKICATVAQKQDKTSEQSLNSFYRNYSYKITTFMQRSSFNVVLPKNDSTWKPCWDLLV